METIDTTKIGLYLQDMLTESKKYIDVDETMAISSAITMMSIPQ